MPLCLWRMVPLGVWGQRYGGSLSFLTLSGHKNAGMKTRLLGWVNHTFEWMVLYWFGIITLEFISNFVMTILASSCRHLWFRPYLVNLLPCLTRITKRQEETVQETLAAAMPKIMVALGHFANDGEIKVNLETFPFSDSDL